MTATQAPPTNTPVNTKTPAATNTASVSPTASLTYTASVVPNSLEYIHCDVIPLFGRSAGRTGLSPPITDIPGSLTTWRLQFFVSRFYDSSLAHFFSPDSLTLNPGSAKSFDRYANALYNPIMFNDPTRHDAGFGNAVSGNDDGLT